MRWFPRKRAEAPHTTAPGEEIPELPSEPTLASELGKARSLLSEELAAEVLPEGVEVTELAREDFQSATFRNAAYHMMPERYGNADRSLTTITLETGAQVYIVDGKTSSGNPYDVWHAAGGGMDLRDSTTTVYAYDGVGAITEYMPNGEVTKYEGEYGTPSALLPYLKQSLGTSVGAERFLAD